MRKRNRHKIIIGIEVMILSITVSLLGPNAASSNPPSNGVSYNKNGQVTVENALDNLYSKANYGNATANDILKGKKALVGGKEVVGTFIPPDLKSQTVGDATAKDIINGKIAWVNGNKIVGTKNISLADQVKLGDYISYTPSSTSYTISSSDTGYEKDQTINPSELNLWRVIRRNVDGTVEVVSVNTSNARIYMQGIEGYKNSIGTLNKLAKSYETEEITVGSRHMGYDGVEKEYLTDEEATIDFERGATSLVDYELVKHIDALKAETVSNFSGYYYLATRYRERDLFGMKRYSGGVGISIEYFSNVYGSYLRPIVILKSDLKITGGDGKLGKPYTFEG